MGHPLLIAGAAAGVAALVFGGNPGKPPLPVNNGGGLQPPPLPPQWNPGPTSTPAPDSGIDPPTTYTGSDGNTYQGDGSGGVIFPDSGTSPVSVPAATPGPIAAAPTINSQGIGVFENVDDTASAPASDGNEDDSDSDGGIMSSSSDSGVSVPASVSGGMVGFHVAGPVGAVVGCVVGALLGPHVGAQIKIRKGVKNPTARKTPQTSPPRHSKVGAYTTPLQNANNMLIASQNNYNAASAAFVRAVRNFGSGSPQAVLAANRVKLFRKYLQQATTNQIATASVSGPRRSPTPSGLVWSRHVNGWTYPYNGHAQGAPPPAGLPVF